MNFKKLLGWTMLVGMLSVFFVFVINIIGIIPVLKVLVLLGATFGVLALVVMATMLIDGQL